MIRPGSEMLRSSSSGTLRSERTSTPRPETPSASRSSSVFTGIALERLTDQRDQVDDAVGVTPLVVVPGNHLGLVVDHLRQARVEYRAVRVGDDVARDNRRVVVLQDTLQRAVRGRLHRGIDLVGARGLGELGGQISTRPGGNRHPKRVAVEFAL